VGSRGRVTGDSDDKSDETWFGALALRFSKKPLGVSSVLKWAQCANARTVAAGACDDVALVQVARDLCALMLRRAHRVFPSAQFTTVNALTVMLLDTCTAAVRARTSELCIGTRDQLTVVIPAFLWAASQAHARAHVRICMSHAVGYVMGRLVGLLKTIRPDAPPAFFALVRTGAVATLVACGQGGADHDRYMAGAQKAANLVHGAHQARKKSSKAGALSDASIVLAVLPSSVLAEVNLLTHGEFTAALVMGSAADPGESTLSSLRAFVAGGTLPGVGITPTQAFQGEDGDRRARGAPLDATAPLPPSAATAGLLPDSTARLPPYPASAHAPLRAAGGAFLPSAVDEPLDTIARVPPPSAGAGAPQSEARVGSLPSAAVAGAVTDATARRPPSSAAASGAPLAPLCRPSGAPSSRQLPAPVSVATPMHSLVGALPLPVAAADLAPESTARLSLSPASAAAPPHAAAGVLPPPAAAAGLPPDSTARLSPFPAPAPAPLHAAAGALPPPAAAAGLPSDTTARLAPFPALVPAPLHAAAGFLPDSAARPPPSPGSAAAPSRIASRPTSAWAAAASTRPASSCGPRVRSRSPLRQCARVQESCASHRSGVHVREVPLVKQEREQSRHQPMQLARLEGQVRIVVAICTAMGLLCASN